MYDWDNSNSNGDILSLNGISVSDNMKYEDKKMRKHNNCPWVLQLLAHCPTPRCILLLILSIDHTLPEQSRNDLQLHNIGLTGCFSQGCCANFCSTVINWWKFVFHTAALQLLFVHVKTQVVLTSGDADGLSVSERYRSNQHQIVSNNVRLKGNSEEQTIIITRTYEAYYKSWWITKWKLTLNPGC